MAKPFLFEYIPAIHAPYSQVVIEDWRNGRTVHTYAQNFVGMLGVMANIEGARSVIFGEVPEEQVPADAQRPTKIQAGGVTLDLRALQEAIARNLFVTSRYVVGPSQIGPVPQLPPTEEIEGNPLAVLVWPAATTISILGIAATAGATWWAIDRNQKHAEVKKLSAQLAAQTDQYAKQLAMAAAMKQPLPAPPKPVYRAAQGQALMPYWQLGAAAVLGGMATYGGYSAYQKVKPKPRRNPAPAPRPRRRVRKKAEPPAPKRRAPKKTTKKAAPKRRRNAEGDVTIRWGAVKNTGPDGGWVPQVWNGGRPKFGTYRSKGFTKAEAERMAKHGAEAEASHYRGDWNVSIKKRANPCGTKRKKNPKKATKRTPARKKVATKKTTKRTTKKANPRKKATTARRTKKTTTRRAPARKKAATKRRTGKAKRRR